MPIQWIDHNGDSVICSEVQAGKGIHVYVDAGLRYIGATRPGGVTRYQRISVLTDAWHSMRRSGDDVVTGLQDVYVRAILVGNALTLTRIDGNRYELVRPDATATATATGTGAEADMLHAGVIVVSQSLILDLLTDNVYVLAWGAVSGTGSGTSSGSGTGCELGEGTFTGSGTGSGTGCELGEGTFTGSGTGSGGGSGTGPPACPLDV